MMLRLMLIMPFLVHAKKTRLQLQNKGLGRFLSWQSDDHGTLAGFEDKSGDDTNFDIISTNTSGLYKVQYANSHSDSYNCVRSDVEMLSTGRGRDELGCDDGGALWRITKSSHGKGWVLESQSLRGNCLTITQPSAQEYALKSPAIAAMGALSHIGVMKDHAPRDCLRTTPCDNSDSQIWVPLPDQQHPENPDPRWEDLWEATVTKPRASWQAVLTNNMDTGHFSITKGVAWEHGEDHSESTSVSVGASFNAGSPEFAGMHVNTDTSSTWGKTVTSIMRQNADTTCEVDCELPKEDDTPEFRKLLQGWTVFQWTLSANVGASTMDAKTCHFICMPHVTGQPMLEPKCPYGCCSDRWCQDCTAECSLQSKAAVLEIGVFAKGTIAPAMTTLAASAVVAMIPVVVGVRRFLTAVHTAEEAEPLQEDC